VNGGRNYNGPKVDRCLREIRLFAGTPGGSGATANSSDKASGADNQQERPFAETRAESSETIRRTSARVSDEEMVPSVWRHAGALHTRWSTHSNPSSKTNSEIPCRVSHKLAPERSDPLLPSGSYRRSPHASCGRCAGNAEGSPRDPVTTVRFSSDGGSSQARADQIEIK
jgi:hypothetical protein